MKSENRWFNGTNGNGGRGCWASATTTGTATRGENYHLFGGSEETHEVMQETAVKFNEKLCDRGKKLEDISKNEFRDIAYEIGLSDKHLPPMGGETA